MEKNRRNKIYLKKWQEQPKETLYKANYGACKL